MVQGSNERRFHSCRIRNVKLSFGLRASPCFLMLGLYKILCMDIEGDDSRTIEFKKLLYSLLYMDNGCTPDPKMMWNGLGHILN